jgi:hypothetical protein
VRRSVLLTLAVTALVALPALGAHGATAPDPNDVASRVDVKRVTITKAADDAPVVVTIRFWQGFADTVLTQPNRVEVWFLCPGCASPAYRGVVTYRVGPGSLRVHLDDLGGSDPYADRAVQRPQPNVLTFKVRAGIAFNQSGVVSAFVPSYDHCASSCVRDRAPDHGRVSSS